MRDLYTFDKKELKYKPYRIYKIISIGLLLFFVILLISFTLNIRVQNKTIQSKTNEIYNLKIVIDSIQAQCNYENIVMVKAGEFALHPHKLTNKISYESVSKILIDINAWYPDVKMALIQVESGFGTSNLAKKANNLCGMKVTHTRETTQLKKQNCNGYGIYNNWESCVVDMVLWDYKTFKGRKPTREEYISTLNLIYAESANYGSNIDKYSIKYQRYFE